MGKHVIRRYFIQKTAVAALACIAPFATGKDAVQAGFNVDFSADSDLDANWQIATWSNGPPFGSAFSKDRVKIENRALSLGFGGKPAKSAEIRTRRFWKNGTFTVDMRPANVRGSISSFFLYAGVAATNSHFEIDIEFIGGTSLLHTNYWIHGRNFPLDFDLAKRGIDPYAGSRRYRFIWAEEEIAWQVQTDAGDWLELRRESARIDTPMQLMMNAWHGDNVGYSKDFPGPYDGSDGVAQYRFVSIER